VLSFAQHEGKGREGKGREGKRSGSTWWVLVAGEETNKNLSTWLRAAAAAVHQSSENEKGREREMQNIPTEGGLQLMQRLRNNNN
jgi:hypothetical protein